MILTEFSNPIIVESVYDPHVFKAIFISGSPGSGKSQFEKSLGLVDMAQMARLDIEDVVSILKRRAIKNPELFTVNLEDAAQQEWYDRAKPLIDLRTQLWANAHTGMVIHNTGRDLAAIYNIVNSLENAYYDCMMLFVNVDKEIAEERILRRNRKIDFEYFTEAYEKIYKNAESYRNLFGENFVMVDNNNEVPSSHELRKARTHITRFLHEPISVQAQAFLKGIIPIKSRRPSLSRKFS